VVDRVLLLPCYKSLYNKGLLDGEHRVKMIDLADRFTGVESFDWEIKNKIDGIGTYEIMNRLKNELNENLYFIMGLDNSQKVRNWKNGHKILNEHKFIVVPRIGTNVVDEWFKEQPHIFIENYQPDDMSSTSVRDLLKNNGDASVLLDNDVYKYIKDNKLYQ